jgi:hypothetical protein
MPLETALVVAVILLAFATFALVLGWADRCSHGVPPRQ